MKVVRIDLADEKPVAVTVELTTDEAVLIATVLGRMTSIEQDAVMLNGDELGGDIWRGFTGMLFNPYWDGGVADALRERRSQ